MIASARKAAKWLCHDKVGKVYVYVYECTIKLLSLL